VSATVRSDSLEAQSASMMDAMRALVHVHFQGSLNAWVRLASALHETTRQRHTMLMPAPVGAAQTTPPPGALEGIFLPYHATQTPKGRW